MIYYSKFHLHIQPSIIAVWINEKKLEKNTCLFPGMK